TSLCIGDQREFGKHPEILKRVRRTLNFLANDLHNEHGFFYHFIHVETGQRWEKCEISSIDTSILLCGVLTSRHYFADQQIKDLIFTHQYSQAWFDFRNKRDAYADYFENSVKATKAHKLFCLSLRDRFPDYSENLWGISASDYVKGYTAWGGPSVQGGPLGPIDGSIVPCAT